MAGIKDVLCHKGPNPYENKITLKVVATDNVVHYTNKDGQQRSSLACAASDGTDVVKVVCFDAAKFPKIKVYIHFYLFFVHDIVFSSTGKRPENFSYIKVTIIHTVFSLLLSVFYAILSQLIFMLLLINWQCVIHDATQV
jgi:hypothetical protein